AAAAVALAAAARAETFQAAAGQAALAHAQRTELGQRAEDLRERLQVLAPETQRLQTEIQAAEERQQELLMHMKENKELLDGLKKRRAETRKQEGYLTSDLLRADGVYASKLADEDESKQRAEASRALAHAVAEVASNFKPNGGTLTCWWPAYPAAHNLNFQAAQAAVRVAVAFRCVLLGIDSLSVRQEDFAKAEPCRGAREWSLGIGRVLNSETWVANLLEKRGVAGGSWRAAAVLPQHPQPMEHVLQVAPAFAW
ncbi:unnamed protein product, partial [Polarella glacialis]